MNVTQEKTAPRKTDAVNVVWRSQAASIMRRICPKLADNDVCLGRLKFSDMNYNRASGYVVFYTLVERRDLSRTQKSILWWKEIRSGKKFGDGFIIMVKAFKNKEGKVRKAFTLPLDALIVQTEYRPNNSFRAVENTEWRYAVRGDGDDCEIINEFFYQKEKRSAAAAARK